MIQQLEKPDKRLVELRTAYGVKRRADGDYSETVFRCPTNGREYKSVNQNVTPIIVSDDYAAVTAYCYWCDTYRRLRGEKDFDRDHTQPHTYPLENDDDNTSARN